MVCSDHLELGFHGSTSNCSRLSSKRKDAPQFNSSEAHRNSHLSEVAGGPTKKRNRCSLARLHQSFSSHPPGVGTVTRGRVVVEETHFVYPSVGIRYLRKDHQRTGGLSIRRRFIGFRSVRGTGQMRLAGCRIRSSS